MYVVNAPVGEVVAVGRDAESWATTVIVAPFGPVVEVSRNNRSHCAEVARFAWLFGVTVDGTM